MDKIKVSISGAAGYVGGELLRILLAHPKVELLQIQSNSQAGKAVYSVHQDLIGVCNLKFSKSLDQKADVFFIANGHGRTKAILEEQPWLLEDAVLIDMSRDFRLAEEAGDFVYGLPELYKEEVQKAKAIANPGCFATAIQLALLPLAKEGILKGQPIHVQAITGSTGAGQQPSATSHFSWRANNLSVYKAFKHQHLDEIKQGLSKAEGSDLKSPIHFIPIRGNFSRGIFASITLETSKSLEELEDLYQAYYKYDPFVQYSSENINLKQVVNSNRCLLHLEKEGDQLLIVSCIDNLIKGAAGQAVQNMNLIFGLEESTGLNFKSVAF